MRGTTHHTSSHRAFAIGQPKRHAGLGDRGGTSLRPAVGIYAALAAVVVLTDLSEWPGSGRSRTAVTWNAIVEAVQKRQEALTAALKALQSEAFNRRLDYYAGWSLRT